MGWVEFKAPLRPTNFTLSPDATLDTEIDKNRSQTQTTGEPPHHGLDATQVLSEKGSILKGKNLLPLGVDPFSEGDR